jgi:O-antigen/teichoic acid export membrane protein
MVGARFIDRGIGLISTVILARVLTPADFGLVAMAMSVIALIELVTAFGFEVPLLRMAQPARAHYDTVWTLNLLFGLGCAAAIALAAWPAAAFYGDRRLVGVLLVLAAGWAIAGTANVGVVDFRRNLDFGREFRLMLAGRLVAVSVTIPAALAYESYWALVAGSTAGRVANVVFSYAWHPYRPRLGLGASRELFSFSVWILVEKIAAFGNSRIADFVLGRLFGPAEVGAYRLAEELAYLPGSELVSPLNRAFLPGASRMTEAGRPIGEVVGQTTSIIALVLVPACIGMAAVAGPMVGALLGAQWGRAVPVLEVLAFNTLLVALWSTLQTALLAAGRPKIPGLLACLRLAVFLPALFLLAPSQAAVGVAIAILISSTSAFAVGLAVALPALSIPLVQYLRSLWRPVAASAVMYWVVRQMLVRFDPSAASLRALDDLLAGVAAGALTYVAIVALLFLAAGRPDGAERLIVSRLAALRTRQP